MVKLVVKWNTRKNNVYTDIISMEYDDITTATIENHIRVNVAPLRDAIFHKIVNINQLTKPIK